MKILLKNQHSYQSHIGSQDKHDISTKDNNGEEGEGGNDNNRDDYMYMGNNMDQANKIGSGDEGEGEGGNDNDGDSDMCVGDNID